MKFVVEYPTPLNKGSVEDRWLVKVVVEYLGVEVKAPGLARPVWRDYRCSILAIDIVIGG